MPAQVRGVAGDNHEMSRSGQDLLVAPGAEVGLAGLRRADAADLDLARLRAGGQINQLLQVLEPQGGTVRSSALAAVGGRSYHVRQVSRGAPAEVAAPFPPRTASR